MRKLFRLSVLAALPLMLLGCPDKKVQPKLNFDGTTSRSITLNFDAAGGDQAINITAQGGEWVVKNNTTWVKTDKTRGNGNAEIVVTVDENTNETGNTGLFTITLGSLKLTVNVTQTGKGTAPAEDILYTENFGSSQADLDNGSDNTQFTGYTHFQRGGVLDQSAVTYASTQDKPLRKSNPPSGAEFSGIPLVFLNSNMAMTISHINVTGATHLILKFAAGMQAGAYVQGQTNYFVPQAGDIKVEIGYDGATWATVPFTGTQIGTSYSIMSAPFSVAANTTEITVRITHLFVNAEQQGGRYDDVQIIKGGNGAEIQPGGGTDPGTGVLKTIAEVRTAGAVNATWYLEGTVVSDQSAAGQNLQAYQIVLQDATTAKSGIMINGASGVDFTGYAVGTKVRVNLTHATWTPYNGLIQLAGIQAADVTTTTNGTAITAPTTITVAQLRTGDYESMLVQIANVELVTKTAQAMNNGSTGNNGNIAVTSGADQFTMRTATRAAFKDSNAPLGKGTLIGIAGIFTSNPAAPANADFQVSPRTMNDVAGMNAGSADYFTVTPSATKDVTAAAGTFDITVSANVAWTVVSSDPSNFTVTAPSAGAGTGNGTITITYTANASTTNTRPATITVATTADVAQKTYAIAVTQAKAAASGTPVNFTAGWDMNGQSNWGDNNLAPSNNNSNSNVTVGGLTRVNMTGSGSAGANSWGGTGWDANTDISNPSRYATFTVTSSKNFSVSTLKFVRIRISQTGAITTTVQYKIGEGAWTSFDNNFFTVNRPSSTTNFDNNTVLMPTALSNLTGGTVVTFRIIPSSVTNTSGAWYISNNGMATGNSFEVTGSYVE